MFTIRVLVLRGGEILLRKTEILLRKTQA